MRAAGGLVAASLLCVAGSALAQSDTATLAYLAGGEAGVLVGRVCIDQDGDGVCSPSELGVAKARIVLSDGRFAVTDGEGRYHIAAMPVRRLDARPAESILREDFGRVLVKLDVDSLGRGASAVGGPRRVVEFGPAALHQVDFPVSYSKPLTTNLEAAPASGPRGEARGGVYRFRATGRTAPDHFVFVEGERAEVAQDGVFAADVKLLAGTNRIAIADLAPEGDLTLYLQAVSVVVRQKGGVLFVPRPLDRVAFISLPDTRSAPAKNVSVTVQAPPETEVKIVGREAKVGAGALAQVELALERGDNQVPIRLTAPGEPLIAVTVVIHARGLSFVSALLSVEMGYEPRAPAGKHFSINGRGTASAQLALGEFDLAGGIDFDSGDGLTLIGQRTGPNPDNPTQTIKLAPYPLVLLQPRDPYSVERVIDPQLYPPVFGDEGTAGSANPSDSRLWLHIQHPRYGEARLGTFHADLSGVDVGRYERSLFGGLIDARVPLGPVTVRLKAFGAPPATEVGIAPPVPAHDEFGGTGGSLFFLKNQLVVPGSEKLRVELRDGITGLPLEERALLRHRDYDLDYVSGRIILAQPLPMSTGDGPLLTTALQSRRPTLVVDYEFTNPQGGEHSQVIGGRASVSFKKYVELGVSGVKEHRLDEPGGVDSVYRLYGAQLRSRLGPVTVVAEGAESSGNYYPTRDNGGFNFSDTGGLMFRTASTVTALPTFEHYPKAYSLRASISEDSYGVQLWARGREAGFSDADSAAQARAWQFGGNARLSVGRFDISAFFDDRTGADPRDPFGAGRVGAMDGQLRATGHFGSLSVTAEGTFASMQIGEKDTLDCIDPKPGDAACLDGKRVGVGLRLDYAFTPEFSLNVSHHQRIWNTGDGPGGLDDTFAAIGATWRPKNDLGLSVRGGWGPGVGTQVQFGAERAGEGDIAYGVWTSDVDGPNAGQMQVVSGARRRVDEHADAFVEDVFARDIDGLRMGRAIGLQISPVRDLTFSARYERGVMLPFTGEPALLRDAGSAKAGIFFSGVRISALAEVRHERGHAIAAAPDGDVERWQTLGGLMADAQPFKWLSLGGRLIASKTRNHGRDEAQSVEAYAAAALRIEPWIVIASYSFINRIPVQGGFAAREFGHLVSLRPSVVLFDRLRIGAGVYAGFYEESRYALSVSLRPAVRIIGGLEVAAEVGRRSSAPQGESLDALRAEVAYWFLENRIGVAVGYNLHGYSGTGVETTSATSDRVYLRLEGAY